MSKQSRRRKQAARNEIVFQVEERKPTRAFVVHPALQTPPPGDTALSSTTFRTPERQLEEALSLAAAIDLDVRGHAIATVRKINPATLFGPGKVEELGVEIAASDAELVIVNTHLSPGQQRNLEKAWNAKVLDRTGLILEIFGRRASTREGRLRRRPSRVLARRPKISRISPVRSSTLAFHAFSRFLCWPGERWVFTITSSASLAAISTPSSSTFPGPNRVAGLILRTVAMACPRTSRSMAAASDRASSS